MDDTKCPLCGEPMEPTPASVVVSCRACNKSWTPRHLAIAAGFRARLIAEAVKDSVPFKRDICGDVFLMFGDNCMISVCGIRDTARGPLVARLLDEWLKSKSVKTNEETS